jgi:hypothetical protein
MFAAPAVPLLLQPMNTEPQAYSIREFVCKWRVLMSRVMALPNFEDDIKGRIFVDIMNEPDSMGIQWAPANSKPGAAELYLQTMDALHELASDSWLYIVEGTGQNMFGLNWVSRLKSTAASLLTPAKRIYAYIPPHLHLWVPICQLQRTKASIWGLLGTVSACAKT